MGVIAFVILDRSTVRRFLCRKNGWATSSWPKLLLQLCDFFCWDRPPETSSTKCPMLRWHQSTNISSVENILVVSLSTPSLICKNAGHTQECTSRPVFCPSYASGRRWPLRNVGHCVNTDVCDTAMCYSTMSIFSFDKLLWQMATTTINNKPEPNLNGIMLRLSHPCELAYGSGLWSLLLIFG